jgi:lipopolysaccharide transport system permease protein
MRQALSEVYQYRQLLSDLIARELKERYRRSLLGFLWSLITPLYQILIMTVVVKMIWNNPTPNYSMQFLTALVPWTFFQASVLNSCAVILRYRQMVKRIWMPTQTLPLAVVGANVVHFLLSMAILVVIFLSVPIGFNHAALFLIVYTVILVLMATGLAMLFSALHTQYQDTEYALTNIMQVFFFLTPVMYPASWVQSHQFLLLFNPMATICEGFRAALLRHELPHVGGTIEPVHLASAAGCAVLCFVVGLWYFSKKRWQFPEII